MAQPTEQLIKILEQVKARVNQDTNVVWTPYNSVDELLADLDSLIAGIRARDQDVYAKLELLFAPTSSIQELAMSNGWGDEYLELAKSFDTQIALLENNQIDFNKSVAKERLVFKHSFEGIFSSFLDYIFWLILPVCTILVITNKRNFQHDTSTAFFFAFVLIFISLWCLLGLYLMNKLVKIKGNNLEDNRQKIIQIMTKEFPKHTFKLRGEKKIISQTSTGLFSWGRRITVLFSNENVYLNITTLGRSNIRSALHAITNIRRCKKIAKEFQNI